MLGVGTPNHVKHCPLNIYLYPKNYRLAQAVQNN